MDNLVIFAVSKQEIQKNVELWNEALLKRKLKINLKNNGN